MLELRAGRRSDLTLFNFYSRLALGGDWHALPLQAQIALARDAFPPRAEDAEVNLVVSHEQRCHLNETIQARAAAGRSQTLHIPATQSAQQNKAQDLILWPGRLLISVVTAKGLYNSQLLVAEGWGDTSVLLRDPDTGKPVRLTIAAVARMLRNTFALTYASCQGRSIDQTLCIHTNGVRFTKKHLFWGLSRGRDSPRVWVK